MKIVLTLLLILCLITPVSVKADVIPVMEHTKKDVKNMGDAAYSENGHTGKTEEEVIQNLIATMGVMLNRYLNGEKWMRSDKYEGILSVIMASGQYADQTKKDLGNIDTPDWVYDLADDVMTYGTNLPKYVIFQSTQKKLGTVWKEIAGEYYATDGGHYMEGKDIVITTNKAKFEAEQRRIDREFNKTVKEIIRKSYVNFSKLMEYKKKKEE